MLLFSFCNKSREYFLLFLKPRGMRKVPERNLYCLHEIRVLKNLFPSCRSVILKWARYCQQHRESVNMKTFHQSEHDTRIWYYETVASKACLQALPLSPLPRLPLGYLTPFFASPPPPPHMRSLVPGHVSIQCRVVDYRKTGEAHKLLII